MQYICVYLCEVCMQHVCMYVCICIYICMYVCMYIDVRVCVPGRQRTICVILVHYSSSNRSLLASPGDRGEGLGWWGGRICDDPGEGRGPFWSKSGKMQYMSSVHDILLKYMNETDLPKWTGDRDLTLVKEQRCRRRLPRRRLSWSAE